MVAIVVVGGIASALVRHRERFPQIKMGAGGWRKRRLGARRRKCYYQRVFSIVFHPSANLLIPITLETEMECIMTMTTTRRANE